jgi:ATP-binding cassette, subfamily B, bacterial
MPGSKFPYYFQHDTVDCGPACLRMVAKYYNKDFNIEQLRQYCFLRANGVSLLGISEGAERIGFQTLMVKTSYDKLLKEVPLPCILHWDQDHFVVLYKIKKGSFGKACKFIIANPNGAGIIEVEEADFRRSWIGEDEKGVLLVLYPSARFEEEGPDENVAALSGLPALPLTARHQLTKFIRPFRRQLLLLLTGLIVTSLLSLLSPFLNQYLVDVVIAYKTKELLALVLFAQLAIFLGSAVIEIVRNTIYLHVSNRLGISLVADFITKLMRLPLNFFDTRSTGDINQRIQDHDKIETFLTSTSLNAIFSLFNIAVFSIVLCIFSPQLFYIFFGMSSAAVGWIFLFQGKRRRLNYKRFQTLKYSQNSIIEMIAGIKDIKLNNSEIAYRWDWERNQVKKFKINIAYLANEQWQKGGFDFLNQLKNILIIYISAMLVIHDQLTVGTMMSIMFLISQINAPLYQLIDFFRLFQDAKISFERRADIENYEPEKKDETVSTNDINLVAHEDIRLENVSFRYASPKAALTLRNVSFTIPKNKVTAIVGPSGCGKTTLLKLLLKFYEPSSGVIKIGNTPLYNVDNTVWRDHCGAVMQDGHVFSDTIARNIVIDNTAVDKQMIERAATVANIRDFIETLPLGFSTRLGSSGGGLSAGQRQRLLIARAVYKDPPFILFDEATSALDARNERVIIENLNNFFRGKTVLVIAHRLSTIKNADQIIVMDEGRVVETGNHYSLLQSRGFYYDLVSNQIEMS